MATFATDLLTGTQFLFDGNFSGSGGTSGSTSWTAITNKPQWLSGTTLNIFQLGHTHNISWTALSNKPQWLSGTTLNIFQTGHNHTYLITPVGKVLYVDNSRTDSYTENGSITKPFKTIMAAINQVISNGDNTWVLPYTINVAAGLYPENLILENTALYNLIFSGNGYRQVIIRPATGISLQSTINNTNLAWLAFQKFEFQKGVNLTGEVSGTTAWGLGYNLFFDNATFSGGNMLFKNIAYPSFDHTRFLCTVVSPPLPAVTLTLSNVTQAGMGPGSEISSTVSTFTMETDQTAGVKIPYGWLTAPIGTKLVMTGSLSSKDVTWSNINTTTWNSVLQVRSSRFGASGAKTIPANSQILAYNSTLIGTTYTIAVGGTLSLCGSFTNGTIINNGTLSSTLNNGITLQAGNTTVAPLKFTSGTLLTAPAAGAIEFLTDKWYGTITTGVARKTFAFLESPTFTGTVTIPTPFTLGAVSVVATGTQINYLTGTTSNIQTQINSKDNVLVDVSIRTGTTYTLLAGDLGKVLEFTATGATTIILPTGLTTGYQITLVNYGGATSGIKTITAGSGATLKSKNGALKLATQYDAATAYYRGSNVWVVFGDLIV